MRWLAWWFRSALCEHEWSYQEVEEKVSDDDGRIIRMNIRVSATCKTCGWHRKYNKY